MPNPSKSGMFRPIIQMTRTLTIMAGISVLCFWFAFNARVEKVSDNFDSKVQAATRMQEAMNILKLFRMEKGVFVDIENDPNETGLVGAQFSLITTDEGDLDAKLTTLDPNFAAAMIELLSRAGLTTDDTVAVLLTGSMPGANMAVLIAAETLGINTVAITSLGASQWGANYPDFTWLDMEAILIEKGMLKNRSIAASIGGRNDLGRLLSPRGRNLIIQNIEKHSLPLIRATSLSANIDMRMETLFKYGPSRGYDLMINVGGGVASLGTSFNLKLLNPGLVTRANIEPISRPDGIEGVMVRFLKSGVNALHILNISALTDMLQMPYAPIPNPEIGKGPLYAIEQFNLTITFLCFLIVAGMVFAVGHHSHNQISQRMKEHEPDSVL
ncbi:MAG: poly-gamma-glutamate system protein [Candidatus Marinimicrobia bacterium]|jgi:poly-gamma-glutamate system protein|nr:poly-gamma-glutamate system protein [Candidatus Neomarinimicrobiota bacterium]MBT3617491.1 poly-gamma-glutamate system protein [Candidatus Neomarinimicrobiota bacterium]MBT3829431.1 poly-gamma-glutamate system protein [Candidatus Neomarinimicrobiota bacterium]MBT3996987.1 poly-gamma-glutamate system protein [Candidatus Neomarinimicrobiota bacterium]MBT4281113.1 poly-gamma-glutamate system protein [Candidatus Neomarinimicrobiota bacterium]